MKGLAITILLALAELGAMATGGGDLLTGGSKTVAAIRRQESNVQSEVLVDAERPEFALLEPAVRPKEII